MELFYPFLPFLIILFIFGLYSLSYIFVCGIEGAIPNLYIPNVTKLEEEFPGWKSTKFQFAFTTDPYIMFHFEGPFLICAFWTSGLLILFTKFKDTVVTKYLAITADIAKKLRISENIVIERRIVNTNDFASQLINTEWPPKTFLPYLTVFLTNVGICAIWEWIEVYMYDVVGVGYFYETLGDSLLGDLSMCVLSTTMLLFLIRFKSIIPISRYLSLMNLKDVAARMLIYFLFWFIGFVAGIDKKAYCLEGEPLIHVGYNAFILFRVCLLFVLKWMDERLLRSKLSSEHYKKEKTNINSFYNAILYFIVIIWGANFGLYFRPFLPTILGGIFFAASWPIINLSFQ